VQKKGFEGSIPSKPAVAALRAVMAMKMGTGKNDVFPSARPLGTLGSIWLPGCCSGKLAFLPHYTPGA
jgi:hypothetical protein